MSTKKRLHEALRLAGQGNLPPALEVLRLAVREDPDDPEAHNCLGAVQYSAKLFEEADVSFRRALEIYPTFPEALNNLGVLLLDRQSPSEAKDCFLRAVQARPDYAAAYNNLGLVLVKEQRWSEAEASFRRAAAINPCFAELFNNLGLLFKDTNRSKEATNCLFRAVKLNPGFAEAHNNLGTVLTDLARFDLAQLCFEQAARLKPVYPDPHHNLGIVFVATQRLEQAEACFSRALELRPDYSEAQFALASLHLLQGRYENGWEKYDKWRIKKYGPNQPNLRRWQGEYLAGNSILLYYEQGFGDTLHFVRYAPLVAKLTDKTGLWVQKPLQRLMASSFPFLDVHCSEEMPVRHFTFGCPLPSLPKVFQTTEDDIPRTSPYIKPAAAVSRKWAEVLARADGGTAYRIGAVWAGNPDHHNDRNRSIPMAIFKALFAITGMVSWVSLQTGDRSSDLKTGSAQVFDWSGQLDDFAETAGLMENLDLVITVDSAVAHLAGAMGKKTWLLLPYAPDWRWQLNREDTPWYPTMRLFRQNQPGDWPEVLQRVKQALAEYLPAGNKPRL